MSTIILLGSILEGVLLDRINSNMLLANTATRAPKVKGTSTIKTFNQWTLDDMIEVSHEVGWIDRELKYFGNALRNYRNLVHPRKQVSEGINPNQGTCEVCWAACKAALDKLL